LTQLTHRPGGASTLGCRAVEIEITPEPSEDERQAILAALAQELHTDAPAGADRDEEP